MRAGHREPDNPNTMKKLCFTQFSTKMAVWLL